MVVDRFFSLAFLFPGTLSLSVIFKVGVPTNGAVKGVERIWYLDLLAFAELTNTFRPFIPTLINLLKSDPFSSPSRRHS
jgi:hypothetical protein